jgi:hypothetical protein
MTALKFLLSLLVGAALLTGAWFFQPGSEQPVAPALIPVSEEVSRFQAEAPVVRVQELYARESQRIGAVDPDPELTRKNLEQVAGELNPEEIRWLLGMAADQAAEGDGRFFAAYLLALSPLPGAVEALGELALSPVPGLKNSRLVELERQLRAQAVEGMGRSCASVVEARDYLLDVVEQQSDEFLRDRAHRALYHCRTGKSVESQDKAALEELLYRTH